MNNQPEVKSLINNNIDYSQQTGYLNLCSKYDGWMEVMQLRDWGTLRKLNMEDCRLSYFNVKVLTNANLTRLQELWLGTFYQFGAALMAKGIKQLARANLPMLKKIDLRYVLMGNEGVRHLTKAKWPNISYIRISRNKIRYHGSQSLYLGSWKNLQSITKFDNEDNTMNIYQLVLMETKNMDIITNKSDRDSIQCEVCGILERRFLKNIYLHEED